jgi:hypothetical protein
MYGNAGNEREHRQEFHAGNYALSAAVRPCRLSHKAFKTPSKPILPFSAFLLNVSKDHNSKRSCKGFQPAILAWISAVWVNNVRVVGFLGHGTYEIRSRTVIYWERLRFTDVMCVSPVRGSKCATSRT